jgi:phenylalanyl-tRNA synthetase beta chain
MKLSLNWLKSYLPIDTNWEVIWHKLTMAGIEIEAITPIAQNMSGIIVGEVISCQPHPEADKLKICVVNSGKEELQIICGASNVTAGIKVPLAIVGATLPDGLVISARKMRGVVSYGMLCSALEIGYQNATDGILILPNNTVVGSDVINYLGLDDHIVEFKITPNRGDCLSVIGILREIKALTDYTPSKLTYNKLPIITNNTQLQIDNSQPQQCSSYYGLVIHNINNQLPLPQHICNRLLASGIRTISPVVDILNYVMLELGQPLHAFDHHKFGNHLHIRFAQSNETLKLLNQSTVSLHSDTLLICDSNDKPAAIAGVMGGYDSGVTNNSTDILIESAWFLPQSIANTSRKYTINSDACYRYERGVDPQLQHLAISYAASLINQYCGGTISQLTQHTTKQHQQINSKQIVLPLTFVDKLVGQQISSEVLNLLTKLDFQCIKQQDTLLVIPPSYRFDINIKQDLVEEITRVYGYDNIIPVAITTQTSLLSNSPNDYDYSTIYLSKQRMLTHGYTEVINYSFLEDKFATLLGNNEITLVKLNNHIAGFNVMRNSLTSSLIKNLLYNINHGHKHVKLFEIAKVFYGEHATEQPLKLAAIAYGDGIFPDYHSPKQSIDFFDIKHVVESILNEYVGLEFKANDANLLFHPRRCADIYLQQTHIGTMGQLHPKIGLQLGIDKFPYLFEIDLSCTKLKYAVVQDPKVAKFQKVSRDLSFKMENHIAVGQLIDIINQTGVKYLLNCHMFDIFALDENYKSVGVNLIFQAHDKTLSDDEINLSITTVLNKLIGKFPTISLRS